MNAPHVQVQLMVLQPGLDRGRSAEAGLYFKLDPGWHIYWKNAGDAGEPPHVQWTLPEGITAGALQFPAPKRLPLGPLMDYGYLNEVLFPLTLKVADTAELGPQVLHAKVDWLVCQSSCIPGRADLEISRNVTQHPVTSTPSASNNAIFTRFIRELPRPLPAGSKAAFKPAQDGFRLYVVTGQKEAEGTFFPADQGILDNPAPQKLTPTPTGLILDLKKQAGLTSTPAQLAGVLELSHGRSFSLVAHPGTIVTGGLVASRPPPSFNPAITPPVSAAKSPPEFSTAPQSSPVLSAINPPAAQLTWQGFARIELFAFLGGLILNLMPCVFPVLFLKGLALVNSRNEEQRQMRVHGFVYAAGILISFWALVAVLLGLRVAGTRLGWGFQFQSPVFLALMAGLLFFLGLSLAGQFEIGVTLTSAGGSLASRRGYSGSFFTGVLAVVVATPCTAPFMGTAIGYALAQPAAVTFAVFTALALGLAVPYVLLTMQPAWTRLLPHPGSWMEVLKQAISVPIFATVIWMAWVLAQAYGAGMLAVLLACLLLLAIAGWFLGRWPAKRWASIVSAMIVLGVIAVCAMAPSRLVTAPVSTNQAKTDSGWETWSLGAVDHYRSEGRPVFVDFTASWCLSCQVNERAALSRPEVQKAFADANVMLLRADWTRHDEAITQTLAGLGRSGVPAYVLYTPGQRAPQILPEVLTPGIVTGALARLPRPQSQPAASAASNSSRQ